MIKMPPSEMTDRKKLAAGIATLMKRWISDFPPWRSVEPGRLPKCGGVSESSKTACCSSIKRSLKMNFHDWKSEKRVIEAYGELLRERMESEDHSYFLTFLFRPCRGSEKVRMEIMQAGIDAFYRALVRQCVRHPRSKRGWDLLPWLIAFPDWPVPKEKKKSVAEVSINGGLHYHALIGIRQQCRLNVPLHTHLREYRDYYLAGETSLFRVRADPVEEPAQKLTSYLFKQANRGRFGSDHVLVLPMAWSELR